MSWSSSWLKLSTSSWLNLISVISLIIVTFHSSAVSRFWYFSSFILLLVISLMSVRFVRCRIFRKFDPVVDLTSYFMKARSCFGTFFLDFSICCRKLRNLSINIDFRCLVCDTGSIRKCLTNVYYKYRWMSCTALYLLSHNMVDTIEKIPGIKHVLRSSTKYTPIYFLSNLYIS